MDDPLADDSDDASSASSEASSDAGGEKTSTGTETTAGSVRILKAKSRSKDIRSHFLKKQSGEPAKKRTRGLGKKTLQVQSSATHLVTIPSTSVFHTFVMRTTQDKERDKRLERAPLADNARDRAVPVAIHPPNNSRKKCRKWTANRHDNANKYSVHDFLSKKVDCYRKNQHKEPRHKCKKGLTYAECGVYVEKGSLMCCGKTRKPHRATMNAHVHTRSHDKFQVCECRMHAVVTYSAHAVCAK